MNPERSLFDPEDPAAEAAADARADADAAAGRVISHDAVRRWIASWGSDKPLPGLALGIDVGVLMAWLKLRAASLVVTRAPEQVRGDG